MGIFDTAAGVARKLGPLGVIPAKAIEIAGETLDRVRGAGAEVPPAARQLGSATRSVVGVNPRELMQTLLERSVEQDTAGGRRDWYAWVLTQLVPDEARIIASLADGPAPPLLHVLPRSGRGRVLENASLIGRTAALTLPAMTPMYVTHLRQLGLVDSAHEDEKNEQGYELLLADRGVREALKEGELSKLPARVLKRTLVLTETGREFWEQTRPLGGPA